MTLPYGPVCYALFRFEATGLLADYPFNSAVCRNSALHIGHIKSNAPGKRPQYKIQRNCADKITIGGHFNNGGRFVDSAKKSIALCDQVSEEILFVMPAISLPSMVAW